MKTDGLISILKAVCDNSLYIERKSAACRHYHRPPADHFLYKGRAWWTKLQLKGLLFLQIARRMEYKTSTDRGVCCGPTFCHFHDDLLSLL